MININFRDFYCKFTAGLLEKKNDFEYWTDEWKDKTIEFINVEQQRYIMRTYESDFKWEEQEFKVTL